jgi:hypothetical protein
MKKEVCTCNLLSSKKVITEGRRLLNSRKPKKIKQLSLAEVFKVSTEIKKPR